MFLYSHCPCVISGSFITSPLAQISNDREHLLKSAKSFWIQIIYTDTIPSMYHRHPTIFIDWDSFSNQAPLPHAICNIPPPPFILAYLTRNYLRDLLVSTFFSHLSNIFIVRLSAAILPSFSHHRMWWQAFTSCSQRGHTVSWCGMYLTRFTFAPAILVTCLQAKTWNIFSVTECIMNQFPCNLLKPLWRQNVQMLIFFLCQLFVHPQS